MGEHFISYSMHLFCYIQCFEVSFQKIWFFLSKAVFFFFFRISIDLIYFSINQNLALKFCEPLPGLIDQTCFSINWTSCFRFFKNSSLTDSNTFSKVFFKLFFSLRLGKATQRFFCRFLPQFLQGFPPSRPVRPFYPSFCSYFHIFMHFFSCI